MRLPSQRIAVINAFAQLNGLIVSRASLHWNLARTLRVTPVGVRARGAKYMSRSSSRWSRTRRAAHHRPSARRATPCPMNRLQEGACLETPVREAPGIRHDLVARVKREIQAGLYETPDKLEAA